MFVVVLVRPGANPLRIRSAMFRSALCVWSRSALLGMLCGACAACSAIAQDAVTPPRVCEIPGSPRIEFLAEARLAGTATDQSGLTGKDRSGVAENLLGSFGSGIEVMKASVEGSTIRGSLIAICDRGPFDGASSFACRAQEFAFELVLATDSQPDSQPGKPASLTLTNSATTMLRTGETQLVGSLDAVQETLAIPTWNLGTHATEEKPKLFPARLDPESIRIAPSDIAEAGIKAGMWWVSEEYGPWVDLFEPVANKPAQLRRRLLLPDRYRVQNPGSTYEAEMPPSNASGRMPNRGLESLALSDDGKTIYAMTQSPLLQDGLLEGTRRAGVNIRLLVIDLTKLAADGTCKPGATREFVYQLSHKGNGTNELLVWNDTTLLVLERDSAKGDKAKKRMLYAIDLAQLAGKATDVAAIDALPTRDLPATITPLSKQPWLDMLEPALALAGPAMPEKIEGIAKGPALPDGRTLLLVAADNDILPEQDSVVWAFAVSAENLP